MCFCKGLLKWHRLCKQKFVPYWCLTEEPEYNIIPKRALGVSFDVKTHPDKLLFEKSKILKPIKLPYKDGIVPTKEAFCNCRVWSPVAFVNPSGRVPAQVGACKSCFSGSKDSKTLNAQLMCISVHKSNNCHYSRILASLSCVQTPSRWSSSLLRKHLHNILCAIIDCRVSQKWVLPPMGFELALNWVMLGRFSPKDDGSGPVMLFSDRSSFTRVSILPRHSGKAPVNQLCNRLSDICKSICLHWKEQPWMPRKLSWHLAGYLFSVQALHLSKAILAVQGYFKICCMRRPHTQGPCWCQKLTIELVLGN